jgi:3-dehydroquinate synthase
MSRTDERAAAPGAPAVWAEIGEHRYPVHLGEGLLDRLGALWAERAAGDAVLLVADRGVAPLAERATAALEAAGQRVVPAPVPAGERSKSLGQVERLTRIAAANGVRRGDAVVALGGGVVGDLAGFVAATYQRGVRLVHVPTTLLAMVDSSIGGKTGVDLPEGKNYVGAIWHPELVVMDTAVLGALPAEEFAAGFAEVVKYGLLVGGDLLAVVEGWPDLPGPADALVDLVRRCVSCKLAVVAEDERDHGRRAVLNLGHTVGHGIEAAGGYRSYRHGEAIALGLLAALRVSAAHAGLDEAWRERVRVVLARHGLPVRLDPDVGTREVMRALARDKKADARALNMVLLAAPGEPLIGTDPSPELVRAAVEELRR